MKYHIYSINDSRIKSKALIHDRVNLEIADIQTFNAYEESIKEFFDSRGIGFSGWRPKVGEAGIWASIILALEWSVANEESVVCFEDDAIPVADFNERFTAFVKELPAEYDFAALWVPNNQRQDYYYYVKYNEYGDPIQVSIPPGWQRGVDSRYAIHGLDIVSRIYQGYGGVAIMYSPAGARKILEIIKERGVFTPSDCCLCQLAHMGLIYGFAPKPDYNMIDYDWSIPTTIHTSEKIKEEDWVTK